MTLAHVFAGGDPVPPERIRSLGRADLVIGADSGAEHAIMSGRSIDLLVGDLDSISPRALETLRHGGTRIEAHPPDKDATDLELALAAAVRLGADEVVVIGGGGGHLDHLLGNVMVMTGPILRGVDVRWILERETAYVVADHLAIPVREGQVFSLIPVGGPAHGVTLTGGKWVLEDARVSTGTSIGISNVARESEIGVRVRKGCLLVIVTDRAV